MDLFCRLAAIPSPSGHEFACAQAVTAELSDLGLDVRRDGAGAEAGSSGDNLYCRLAATALGRPLFFCAHLDTVPPTAPLEPVVVDGVIRNATPSIVGADNKAAVAVMLDAIRALVVERIRHAGVELVFTFGEEQGLIGSTAFACSTLHAKTGFVFDHPGAIGGYVAAAPSRFVVRATVRGRAAHSAIAPQDGVNAIVPLARAIAAFPQTTDAVNVNVALVTGGTAMNVVPDGAGVTVDVRAIEHAEGQAVADGIGDTLRAAAAQGGCEVAVDIAHPYSAYRVPAESEALRLALAAFTRLGLEARPWETRGGSDANVFCKRGLDCVNLTQGVKGFHAPDERVAIADLELMRSVMLAIIAEGVTSTEPG